MLSFDIKNYKLKKQNWQKVMIIYFHRTNLK